MSVEEKRSSWSYFPPILAAVLVAGSVAYFNYRLWEYPYFNISWEYGWPLRYRFQSYVIYSDTNISSLSHDEIYYGAIAANIAIGVVLIALGAWGIWHLNKINRSLFRIHLQTILLVVLTIGGLMLLNTRVREYRGTPEIRAFGWPYEVVAMWKDKERQGIYDPCWLNVYKNAFVALYTLFLVTLASESWLAWRTRKKSTQPPT